jgi:hypothetical protein
MLQVRDIDIEKMKRVFKINVILKILWSFALLLTVACVPRPDIAVDVLPGYEALFQKEDGWTGADGVYSVALAEDTTLWLFGDTWIGQIRNGRHENAQIINNSIGIQHGKQPSAALLEFYYGKTPDGKPTAFILPLETRGWLWMYHGARTSEGLFLFFVQIDRTAENSVFGFKVIGNWLGHVTNPEDPPMFWHIRQRKIPWSKFSASGDTIFGSALLKVGGFFYTYGTTEEIENGIRRKYMILARVPEFKLYDFDQWRFFAEGQWISDASRASRLCADIANEYSVSFQPALGKYISVYSQNSMSNNIVARTAPEPYGPWSEPSVLYRCPEEDWHDNIFCYAAKAHPQLSLAPDELIITYVANSMDFHQIESDARLYRPRFLRVRFEPSGIH